MPKIDAAVAAPTDFDRAETSSGIFFKLCFFLFTVLYVSVSLSRLCLYSKHTEAHLRAGECIKGIEKCHKKIEEIIHRQNSSFNRYRPNRFDLNVFANV